MMRIIDGFDVVEVRSPILDISFLSAGYQPVVTMRPCGGRDAGLELVIVSLVVSLACRQGLDSSRTHIHDSLKVKGRPIPKHEFSSMSASQQSSTFGRPSHYGNRFL